ncbi:MAG: hypothetical protein NWE89_08860 [Candidatus Bathyarchaeota archaeon]|nr:hypothetical protein [Candidatus Bathyarchaeota archaeon]
MVEELLDDKKFIVVPKRLADRVKLVSGRLGGSVTDYAIEVFTQALRVDEMGSNLKEAVDVYHLVTVQQGAGKINVTKANMGEILSKLSSDKEGVLSQIWYESGKWYGAYLSVKLKDEDILGFLETDLLLTWNLDEVEIRKQDLMVTIRCTSFTMSMELTDLLVNYLVGLMEELGFIENERDVLRGLVTLKFLGQLK